MGTTNLKYLRSICDNDQRFMKEMILTFLELTPMLIAQMQILSKEGKWHELSKTAHQLKPSLQFMGMDPARNKVKEIEDICSDNPDHSVIIMHIMRLEKDCKKAFVELNGVMKKEFVSV
jgi:HPt (histidine-containing phosphotransfer) domain-containing protein